MGGRGTSFKAKTRKVPELPAAVKEKLLKGKGDRIAAKTLGLAAQKSVTNFNKKTRAPKKNVDITKLNINGANLSKSRLLQLEKELAGGLTRKGVAPIVVAPVKGKPGQYSVLGKGNGDQRIAYLKLAGFNGKVPVTVVTEGRRNLPKKQAAKAAAKRLASGGGRKRAAKKSSKK